VLTGSLVAGLLGAALVYLTGKRVAAP
jgi:hypothetical protein